jgi:hypothetical protein
MTQLRDPARAPHRRPLDRAPDWLVGREAQTDARELRLLVVLTVVLAACVLRFPDAVPLGSLVVPLLLAGFLLSPRRLPWFVVFVLVLVAVLALRRATDAVDERDTLANARVFVVVLVAAIVLWLSRRRARLGVGGALGESMLVDLRDRILGHGRIPELPEAWYAETALRSAGGSPFAGDFVVTALPRRSGRFEVAVVDVSGKGEAAGTRALLLSGALGGLLGALPPADFLPAANDYLVRQGWEEGFATAIHLSLDLGTGEFEVRSAGHPPAVQRIAGSGRWVAFDDPGPALGLFDDPVFPAATGQLRSGDAMLLYTDGMVERRRRDIGLGIDQLLGRAEDLLRGDVTGGAARLVEQVGARDDDRALLLVHRR